MKRTMQGWIAYLQADGSELSEVEFIALCEWHNRQNVLETRNAMLHVESMLERIDTWAAGHLSGYPGDVKGVKALAADLLRTLADSRDGEMRIALEEAINEAGVGAL